MSEELKPCPFVDFAFFMASSKDEERTLRMLDEDGAGMTEFVILLCVLPVSIPSAWVVGLTLAKWYKRRSRHD